MDHDHSGHMDAPAMHGMVIFGEETVYLSHLPMFGPPHNYQVILEVTFTGEGDPQAVYVQDRRESGERIYSIFPETFSLPKLASADPAHPRLETFKANIVRGHFEKPGAELILSGVDVNVEKVIHFRKFDPEAEALPELEYFLFGKGEELFLAHLITRPPDFDQILEVKQVSQDYSDEELAETVRFTFPGFANTVEDRMNAHQRAFAATVPIIAGDELYFEEGELMEQATFTTTKAEQQAGFI